MTQRARTPDAQGSATAHPRLRDASIVDLDALLQLERACYPPQQAYSADEYRYSLAKAKAVNLLWETPQEIIGFVGAFHHSIWRAGHVYTLNVHPKARGQGLGARLMEAAHERLRALGMTRVLLEVNVDNAAAIKLYEKGGYTLVRRLPDYYSTYSNNDAFLYERPL